MKLLNAPTSWSTRSVSKVCSEWGSSDPMLLIARTQSVAVTVVIVVVGFILFVDTRQDSGEAPCPQHSVDLFFVCVYLFQCLCLVSQCSIVQILHVLCLVLSILFMVAGLCCLVLYKFYPITWIITMLICLI